MQVALQIWKQSVTVVCVCACPQDFSVHPLDVGAAKGTDRLLLWLPMTITHVIDEASPLSNWKNPEDSMQDADATIVILVTFIALSSHLLSLAHCTFVIQQSGKLMQ